MPRSPLSPEDLRWRCPAEELGFETTESLAGVEEAVGQARALEAIRFGIGIRNNGYNIYALGPDGVDMHATVRHHLQQAAASREVPADYCYVNNFDVGHKPLLLKFPAGRGIEFQRDTDQLADELRDSLRMAFESEEFHTRRRMLENQLQERHEQAISEVEEEAREHDVALQRTPAGLLFAPFRDGKPLDPESFEELPDEDKRRIEKTLEHLQQRLQQALQKMPEWIRETREQIKRLNEETASYAVGHLIEALKRKYDPLEAVQNHLERVREDIIEHVDTLLATAQQKRREGPMTGEAAALNQRAEQLLRRYRTNLLIDNSGLEAAPVVYADDPNYEHLIGRIEHRSEMGTLTTDFHLIRPGALHRANGGYLMLDMRRVLMSPFAWEALKRVLRAGEVRIEPAYQSLGLFSTVTLEPEPIPLDVQVVLIGERFLYYLASALDPDFGDLFKIAADFDEDTPLDVETRDRYACMLATLARRHELAPLDAPAVARALEEAARRAGEKEKLSLEIKGMADLLREADHHARSAGRELIDKDAVQAAIDGRERRMGRLRERLREEILRGTLMIDTEGRTAGQINALTVLSLAGFSFGKPTRVTARIGLGRGNVVDIEREVKLGGPIHSKGVLILGGFLSARFARERPLALTASLVFEQSYGGVEGDSASLAELVCLLSAIGEVPLRQDLAVTGSVNQHGQVQAIGGVNEKIEGFFDLCRERGFSGHQGVVIPASNIPHLMLREEVVEAAGRGEFGIWAVETVDEALELFGEIDAGLPDEDGRFPAGSFNGIVQRRLDELAEKRRSFARNESGASEPDRE